MTLRHLIMIVVIVAGLHQGWQLWTLRPVHPADGVIAREEPIQSEPRSATPIAHGRWTLTPRAHYDITARILRRENYTFDGIADLVPEDLALGWGAMSDSRILRVIEVDQGARFYSWRIRGEWPIPRQEIVEHSANVHVIPADASVKRALARLRMGQVVHLEGELVDGVRDDGATIQTSLTRTDSGAGACEVLYVEAADVR